MSHVIIDRRLNDKKKSSVNRQRFIKRVKQQAREAVKKSIREGKIEDIVSDKTEKVNVPAKDIGEPTFRHGQGGVLERVFPGNHKFITGDRIQRPQGGEGGFGRGEGSESGYGEDNFQFTLTKDEFMDIFFEDLELPDLVKTDLATMDDFIYRHAGFVSDGSPSRLSVVRSLRQAHARRIALRNPKAKKLKRLEEELENLNQMYNDDSVDEATRKGLKKRIEEIKDIIVVLERKIKAVPFLDDIDLRYRHMVKQPQPINQAVMFCLMDVSGSMTEDLKEMAKRFFMLLYLFLTKSYDRIDIVFIRHHTEAMEVDQQEFFYSRETGGTIVSSALQLMHDIITQGNEHHPGGYNPQQWNIYACQASDGDNWTADCPEAVRVLETYLLPLTQYFAYIEINTFHRMGHAGELWPYYEKVKENHNNFNMAIIKDPSDIYPVFRGLFEKEKHG